MTKKIENYTRQSVFIELQEFCPLSKEHSFIEMTEWKNGEGVDLVIASFQDRIIQLTFGELQAIRNLTNKILEQ